MLLLTLNSTFDPTYDEFIYSRDTINRDGKTSSGNYDVAHIKTITSNDEYISNNHVTHIKL